MPARNNKRQPAKKASWRRARSTAMVLYRGPRAYGTVNSDPVHFNDRWTGIQEWYSASNIAGSMWTRTGTPAGGASLAAWSISPQAQTGLVQGGFAVLNTLQDMLNYTNFAAMWDAYRIVKVHMRIESTTNSGDPALNAVIHDSCPSVTYALDQDDAVTPTSENVVLAKKGARTHTFTDGKPLIISWTPKVATAIYGGGAFSSYGQASPWIDSINTTVEYYGMKLWWRNLVCPIAIASSNYGSNIRIGFKLEVEFKTLIL